MRMVEPRILGILFVLVLLPLTGASCAPDDAKRCGDGFRWDSELNTCFKSAPAAGETDAGTDASGNGASGSGAGEDSSDDAGAGTGGGDEPADTPQGLGDVCTDGGGQCAGLEADYCAVQPGQPEGFCTVQGCSTSPDDCPDGYRCCAFSGFASSYPDFCITDEMYGLMGPMCEP